MKNLVITPSTPLKKTPKSPIIPAPAGMKRFACHAWQGKELAYVRALKGYDYVPVPATHLNVRFGLFDLDINQLRGRIDELHRLNIPVFLYPHAARPMVQWDGMYEPFPHTRCSFVIGPGHAEVMRRFGYQIPTEVTGWTMCKLIPFEPVKEVRTILFGPIHPNSNGYLSDLDGGFNQDTLRRLYEYSKASGARLVVRHVRALEKNLIPRNTSS